MSTPTPGLVHTADLETVNAAITVLCDYEAQDRTLVCDMASAMLSDLAIRGALGPLDGYLRLYCDVLDGPDDMGPIVARIQSGVHYGPTPSQ
jgi:hypothetical protein